MIRICCLCERWESGGIESFLCNTLSHMDLTCFEVDIVVASMRKSIFTEPLRNRGVRFFELSGNQRNILGNFLRFKILLRERHYDIVYLNAYQGLSLYYLKVAKQMGVPVRIAHSHNTALRKGAARPIKLAIHYLARSRYTSYATELWGCSSAAADFLFNKQELKKRGFRFVPNGVDVERFRFDSEKRAAVRAQLGIESCFVVGNVGRLCYQKNQMFLLDVFAEVCRQKPHSYLLLVGDGEDKGKLQAQCKMLGLGDKVLFCGTTEHVEQMYWAMDVFVLPSRFEGLSVAAVEAQAAGLPVVCSAALSPEIGITDSCCFVRLQDSFFSWVRAICSFPQQKGRRRAADKVRNSGFEITDIAEMITEHFSKKVNNGC